jgi:hypothetical protein
MSDEAQKGVDADGPAFPLVASNGPGHVSGGMTLHQYFAGQALVGLLSGEVMPGMCSRKGMTVEQYRGWCVSSSLMAADEMIAAYAEREKERGQ